MHSRNNKPNWLLLSNIGFRILSSNISSARRIIQIMDCTDSRSLYNYNLIKSAYAAKNQCVVEWFNQPRYISQFIDKYGIDALDSYSDHILNRYVIQLSSIHD